MSELEVFDSAGNPIKLTAKQRREILKEVLGVDDIQLNFMQQIENGGPGDVIEVDEDGKDIVPVRAPRQTPKRKTVERKSLDSPTGPTSEVETIRCLSIKQPYTDLIFYGDKWAENRSWNTNITGELWIASTVSIDEEECRKEKISPKISPSGMLRGHLLGRVNLIACVKFDDLISAASQKARQAASRMSRNRKGPKVEFCRTITENFTPESWRHVSGSDFVWIFSEPEVLEKPIPVKGKLGLWNFEVETARLVLAGDRKRN